MSSQSSVLDAPKSMSLSAEFRVWERHTCGIETACQPIAARGDNAVSWPGEIHDVSVAGLGLVLGRRFERGAGLAIDIPETATAPADTLLAKVVHVTTLPDKRWLLGCAFVSKLSEDEVWRLVAMGQGQPAAPENATNDDEVTQLDLEAGSRLIQDVTWTGSVGGKVVHRLVRRVHLNGTWPLAGGTILKVWFGKHPTAKARLRIDLCCRQNSRWLVDYTFLGPVTPAVLQSFGHRSG
jgi:hypothetical protein